MLQNEHELSPRWHGILGFATAADASETDVASAYNPDDDQYLVVWTAVDNVTDEIDIMGRRLTGGGTVTTTDSIQLNTNRADVAFADVVYQPAGGQYLAVWGQTYHIYGRGIQPDGTLATTNPYTITAETEAESNPRLAVDAGGALALWQTDGGSSGDDLWARPLTITGQPASPAFSIQVVNEDQQVPALAYGSNNRYQLVWQDNRDGGWNLYTATLDRNVQVTAIAYTYDPLQRLAGAVYSGDLSASYEYVYDAVGNMTAYTETIGTATNTISRTYDAANQLLISSDTELGTSSFYYDGNGSLVEILPPGASGQNPAGSIRYGFDQRHLLITQSTYISGTGWTLQAAFIYDGAANRLQQEDYTGSTTRTVTYTNDIVGLSQVLVASEGITTTHNLFGLDLILSQEVADAADTTRLLLADGLGSVRTEVVSGAIERVTTYEPYGKVLAATGDSGTAYGFTGEQLDAVTGLVFLRARYYHPSLRVFMSRDAFPGYPSKPATQHDYSYVSNDPINRTDPSGHCEEYLPDESCWALYDRIVTRFPEALNRKYFYRDDWVELHELPAARLQNELADYEWRANHPDAPTASEVFQQTIDEAELIGRATLATLPLTGDIIDVYQVATHNDFVSGDKLPWWEVEEIAFYAGAFPLLTSGMLRYGDDALDAIDECFFSSRRYWGGSGGGGSSTSGGQLLLPSGSSISGIAPQRFAREFPTSLGPNARGIAGEDALKVLYPGGAPLRFDTSIGERRVDWLVRQDPYTFYAHESKNYINPVPSTPFIRLSRSNFPG